MAGDDDNDKKENDKDDVDLWPDVVELVNRIHIYGQCSMGLTPPRRAEIIARLNAVVDILRRDADRELSKDVVKKVADSLVDIVAEIVKLTNPVSQ